MTTTITFSCQINDDDIYWCSHIATLMTSRNSIMLILQALWTSDRSRSERSRGIRKSMTVGKPKCLQLDQRIKSIQHGRLDGVVVTDFEPKDVLDPLVISPGHRVLLRVYRSRIRYEPGLELRPLLGNECNDVIPVGEVG